MKTLLFILGAIAAAGLTAQPVAAQRFDAKYGTKLVLGGNSSGVTPLTILAPAAGLTSYSLTLPSAVGTIGQTLITTDGSGTLGWLNLSGSNTGDVTLGGTANYLSITGQTITRNAIDLSNTNNITSTLPVSNGGTGNNNFTSHGLVVGSSSQLSSISTGTTGQLLVSADGTGDPTWLGQGSTGNLLLSSGSGSNPAWSAATLSASATGTVVLALTSSGTTIKTQGSSLGGTDSTNATTTLKNTGLTITLGANETWTFECMMSVNGGNSTAKAGIDIAVTGTNSPTIEAFGYGTGSSGAGSFTSVRISVNGTATNAGFTSGNNAANDGFIAMFGSIAAGSSGSTINIQFATHQTPNTVTIRKGSYINARKM